MVYRSICVALGLVSCLFNAKPGSASLRRHSGRHQFRLTTGEIVTAFIPGDYGAFGDSTLWVNVISTGAKCDGSTNDTLAIQAAINATPILGGGVLFPASGTCVSGNLTVPTRTNFSMRGLGAMIQWTGTGVDPAYIGIQLTGNLTNAVFESLILNGDGLVSNRHAGIWNFSGQTYTNIVMRHNQITNVVFGAGLGADGSGSIQGLEISENTVDNIVGTLPGIGYGLYHASTSPVPARVWIVNNQISRAQRHSIYQGRGAGVVIANNVISRHRTGQGVPGSQMPAIEVARSQDVVVSGNQIDMAQDGAIDVSSGEGATCRNVTVTGNVITNGVATGIVIGTSDPLTNGPTTDVLIAGNSIDSTTQTNPQLYIFSGIRVTIVGNTFKMLAVPGTGTSVFIRGSREGAGTATYTDEISIKMNLFSGTNGGGTYTPIEFGPSAATSGIRVDVVSNLMMTSGNAFVMDAPQTAPNIRVFDTPITGLIEALLRN